MPSVVPRSGKSWDLPTPSLESVADPGNNLHLTGEGYLRAINRVSHDVCNSLCVISEYSSLMRDGILGPLSAEQVQMINVIDDRANEIHALMESLLTMTRLDCGQLMVERRECSVDALLNNLTTQIARSSAARQILFDVRARDPLPAVYCDEKLAGNVLLALWWWTARAAQPSESVLLEVEFLAASGQVVFRWATNVPRYGEAGRLASPFPAAPQAGLANPEWAGEPLLSVARSLARQMGGGLSLLNDPFGLAMHLNAAIEGA